MSVFFQKSIRLDSAGALLLKSNILLSESPEVAIHRCSRTFQMVANFTKYILWNLKKYLGLVSSIFLSTSEGLLLNIPEISKRFYEFSISHFSSLEIECTEASVCSCFSKWHTGKPGPGTLVGP